MNSGYSVFLRTHWSKVGCFVMICLQLRTLVSFGWRLTISIDFVWSRSHSIQPLEWKSGLWHIMITYTKHTHTDKQILSLKKSHHAIIYLWYNEIFTQDIQTHWGWTHLVKWWGERMSLRKQKTTWYKKGVKAQELSLKIYCSSRRTTARSLWKHLNTVFSHLSVSQLEGGMSYKSNG